MGSRRNSQHPCFPMSFEFRDARYEKTRISKLVAQSSKHEIPELRLAIHLPESYGLGSG
ncbi:hypothetical protein AciX8_1375 [Granulicella mallensis MP5ACTX8]|uniref:Uncharacterized protein n=1 Tax=Granulicella mallensis (strain ATCC BAA-1857 / DSM 23137 / MP5ACTX8) TaxID=682795 RepID=G8P002_GRAMM|nr:hypothetical protein AciX8_1375 [Granulicella mallensis MP5ACTX8]